MKSNFVPNKALTCLLGMIVLVFFQGCDNKPVSTGSNNPTMAAENNKLALMAAQDANERAVKNPVPVRSTIVGNAGEVVSTVTKVSSGNVDIRSAS
jgi:hypothetical protein